MENALLNPPCQEITSPAELATAVDELAQRLQYFDERRSTRRYAFNVPLSLYRKTETNEMEKIGDAWGLNLSTLGLGFLSRKSFPRGSQIYVDLKPLTGDTVLVKLTVVHCSDPVDEIYRVGGYFAF